MPDPIMLAVATTLAVRAAEAVADGGTAAWSSLVALVRRRFATDEGARRALEDAQANPDDQATVQVLAGSLDRLAEQDRDFDAELRDLWTQIADAEHERGTVVNHNSGTVTGSLLQGRDFTLNGQLHFGGASEPR
jgi:hypothetical protein